ncbi:hypothetical protein PT974_04310 [Cladobotryum mycophilum]|uniref:Endosomal spry domain-containing protein n=1 Tax=Cladobotryum mycophilum TaxID=491253 RepID=A0ABR0SUQ1_9HYPO
MAPAISIRDVFFGQPSVGINNAGLNDDDYLGAPVDGPLAEAGRLLKRVTKRDNVDPTKGVLDPHDINNAGFFFLFAIIGVAFVLVGIWFFFWAKNGGIQFKEDDWDDYKSTVMRRKGPNGTILSNATKSTKLGGGSAYKEYDDDGNHTVITESTALSGITAGPSDIFAREKREEKRRRRDADRRKRRASEKKKSKRTAEEGILDEKAEKEAQEQLRNYRHERPARVGGLNKEAEGSQWDGSTNAGDSNIAESTTASSGLLSGAEKSTTAEGMPMPSKPAKTGGIRKVYSVADRTTARENERMRAEARRLREEGKVSRRDFSYQRAIGAASQSQLSESLLSSSQADSAGGSSAIKTESEVGTKSYHHPLPELKEHRRREREERRTRRGGYRRGNTKDEDEDID